MFSFEFRSLAALSALAVGGSPTGAQPTDPDLLRAFEPAWLPRMWASATPSLAPPPDMTTSKVSATQASLSRQMKLLERWVGAGRWKDGSPQSTWRSQKKRRVQHVPGKRSKELPMTKILDLGRFDATLEGHRAFGASLGRRTASAIQAVVAYSSFQETLVWAQGASGVGLFSLLKQHARRSSPRVWAELEGLAEGSGTHIDAVFLVNALEEMNAAWYYWNSGKKARKRPRKELLAMQAAEEAAAGAVRLEARALHAPESLAGVLRRAAMAPAIDEAPLFAWLTDGNVDDRMRLAAMPEAEIAPEIAPEIVAEAASTASAGSSADLGTRGHPFPGVASSVDIRHDEEDGEKNDDVFSHEWFAKFFDYDGVAQDAEARVEAMGRCGDVIIRVNPDGASGPTAVLTHNEDYYDSFLPLMRAVRAQMGDKLIVGMTYPGALPGWGPTAVVDMGLNGAVGAREAALGKVAYSIDFLYPQLVRDPLLFAAEGASVLGVRGRELALAGVKLGNAAVVRKDLFYGQNLNLLLWLNGDRAGELQPDATAADPYLSELRGAAEGPDNGMLLAASTEFAPRSRHRTTVVAPPKTRAGATAFHHLNGYVTSAPEEAHDDPHRNCITSDNAREAVWKGLGVGEKVLEIAHFGSPRSPADFCGPGEAGLRFLSDRSDTDNSVYRDGTDGMFTLFTARWTADEAGNFSGALWPHIDVDTVQSAEAWRDTATWNIAF